MIRIFSYKPNKRLSEKVYFSRIPFDFSLLFFLFVFLSIKIFEKILIHDGKKQVHVRSARPYEENFDSGGYISFTLSLHRSSSSWSHIASKNCETCFMRKIREKT